MSFCYWTVADNDHAELALAMVKSARAAGVTEEIIVYTDREGIERFVDEGVGVVTLLNCGVFDHAYYLFKFDFLIKVAEARPEHDYYVFLDADCMFVRNPPPWEPLLRKNNWFAQMENNFLSPFVCRQDWWGCPVKFFIQTLRYKGVTSDRIYNTNAGMFIVRKGFQDDFRSRALEFFKYCRHELGLKDFTEEAALAYVGHLVDDPETNTLAMTSKWWATEWIHQFNDYKLPDGKMWFFEDYLTGERHKVNPAIVHCLKAKEAMRLYARGLPLPPKPEERKP